jgi:hypothetical protein
MIVSDPGEWNRIVKQHELFVTVRSDEKVETFEERNRGNMFVEDVSERVSGPVQIATGNLPAYPFHIRQHVCYEGYSYDTETKILGEPRLFDGTQSRIGRNEGIAKMQTAERRCVPAR